MTLSNYYRQLFSDYHARSKKPELVMQWTLKAVAGSPRDAMLFRCWLIVALSGLAAFVVYLARNDLPENLDFVLIVNTPLVFLGATMIAASYAKTNYRYRIFKTHARLAYCQNVPKHAETVLKGLGIVGICVITMIALMSGSILILAGPGGIAVFAALRLLNMKVPRKRRWSAPWDEYNFVTVDRKRRFVVTHIEDQTLGFEARLPNDELLEQYLAFLRSALPPTAQFTEKKWNLSLI